MSKRFSSREQSIFVVCLVLATAYLVYYFGIVPLRERSAALDKQIQAEIRKIKKNKRGVNQAKQLDFQYDVMVQDYVQKGTDEEVMSEILREIEQVARNLGLNVSDLKPQRVRRTEFYNLFSVSVRIDSSLADIIQFVHSLQSRPHNFDVQELRFDKSSRRDEKELKTMLVLQKILVP